jgi:4-amino-4-deoxy-L-arabinose transferase-like glycosyltransferase
MTPEESNSPASPDSSAPAAVPAPVAVSATKPWTAFWDRLSERQMVIAVCLFGLLLYLPMAGSYGLWDPWETHYGEVAREMVARGDAISLYWAGSPIDPEVFWSKPVLSFWLISLSMLVFGLGNADPGTFALSSRPEWALRTPFILMSLLALAGVYLAVSRFVSRRAGVLSTLALATCPLFSLVARQAMTDMAFVGPMTMALALGALALFDDEDRELPRRGRGRLSWPHHTLFYVTVGLLALTVLPQIVLDSIQLRWEIWPKRHLVLPGVVAMLPYTLGFLAFLWFAAKIRYKAPFYLMIAAILCGLAILAKGLAGLGLPVIVFLAYLFFTWNWRRLNRAQLISGVWLALLACALVSVPWHHAMLARHGFPFWNELYGDNHWRRMVLGRHGDRGSFEYFLRELGYGLYPWIALVPAALSWVVMRTYRSTSVATEPGEVATTKRRAILHLGAIWFVACYAVVSCSMTKFHHYILPAIPGVAIVLGCFVDDLLKGARGRVVWVATLIGLPLLFLVTADLIFAQKNAQHFIWLFSYDYINTPQGRPWPPELDYRIPLAIFAGLFAVSALLLGWRRARKFGLVGIGLVSVVFTYFLLDSYMKNVSNRWSQKPLMATYYKERASSDERLVAWQMYWRGETFYTQNEIFEGPKEGHTVFLGDRNAEDLKDYLRRNPGKRVFFVVERTRFESLRGLLPEGSRSSLKVVDDRNNKFYLASAQM